MRCPFCSHLNSQVLDSRDSSDSRIRRRRECLSCKRRFTTYETLSLEELYVVKREGGREPFDKHKLAAGILRACVKRPVSREQVDKIVESVEHHLRKSPKHEVSTTRIGQMVMERLRKVDQVAYIRFASVYESFTDLASFDSVLRSLKKKDG